MKAIRVTNFGGPEVLQLTTLPDPTPGPGQILVRVQAIGINPVDAYVRAGTYPNLPSTPYTPGTDTAGIIEAVGPDVPTKFRPGARVYTFGSVTGAYAELTLCTAAQVYPLPDCCSFPQGAALGVPYGTAYRALFQRGGAKQGETLLVHGASGGVGTAAVQLARGAGLRIAGTAGTERGLELVREQGAHLALNHHDADYLDKAKEFTGGDGFNIILEMMANTNLGKDLPQLATTGRVVVIGSRGPAEINPRDIMGREADIRGMTLMRATPDELIAIHAALYEGLGSGALKPIVGETFPLAEAAKSHEAIMESSHYGKIVLTP